MAAMSKVILKKRRCRDFTLKSGIGVILNRIANAVKGEGLSHLSVAGMVILQEVMEAARASSFTVSESDILEGIVLFAARV